MNETIQAQADFAIGPEADQTSRKFPIETQQLIIGVVFILAIVALVMLKGFLSSDEELDEVTVVEVTPGD